MEKVPARRCACKGRRAPKPDAHVERLARWAELMSLRQRLGDALELAVADHVIDRTLANNALSCLGNLETELIDAVPTR